ncbi:MAG: hypothetical protein WCA30_11695 [Dermatophilaceae bacterium]
MDIFEARASATRDPGSSDRRTARWWVLTLGGGAAFWLTNLAISMTPIAAEYRSTLSIPYVPMLLEAAVGGLVIAGAISVLLTRFPSRVPGSGPLPKAVLLAVGALVLLTVLVELPTKLGSELAEPGRWLLVALVFNTIRFLALGLTIGLIARARATRQHRHHEVTRRKAHA